MRSEAKKWRSRDNGDIVFVVCAVRLARVCHVACLFQAVNDLVTELEQANITCTATITFAENDYKEQLRTLKVRGALKNVNRPFPSVAVQRAASFNERSISRGSVQFGGW